MILVPSTHLGQFAMPVILASEGMMIPFSFRGLGPQMYTHTHTHTLSFKKNVRLQRYLSGVWPAFPEVLGLILSNPIVLHKCYTLFWPLWAPGIANGSQTYAEHQK